MTPTYDILRKTGSRRNGFERDGGVRFHAVPRDGYRAICGTTTNADWSYYHGEAVTCPRCLQKLEKQAAKAAQKEPPA